MKWAPGVAALALVAMPPVLALVIAGAANPADAACSGPVPASVDIDAATRSALNTLRPTYVAVAQRHGVPWQALAALDYREAANDPQRSALAGEALGQPDPDHPDVVAASKEDSLDRAAGYLVGLAASVYGVALTATSGGADVQLAFLAYNRGSIYRDAGVGPDRSPYVFNQFDAAHADMAWPDIAGEPLAGQVEYGRYGAWTLFVRLGGGGGSCSGLSPNDIVRVAQSQLGHREEPDGCNCGPQIQPYLGSSPGEEWCADFVSWVYMAAGHPFSGGLDGGWRLPGVAGLADWLAADGEWHPRGADADVPRPGDVIVFGDDDHVGIVERVDGGEVDTIEGNTANQVGRRAYPGYTTDAGIVGWGRMRAAP